MALRYPTQRKLECFNLTQGGNFERLSEARAGTFGGRGGILDEIRWLKEATSEVNPSFTRTSDGWVSFGSSWVGGTAGKGRADQARRTCYETGSLA